MTLLLVRHGETALNASRTLQPPDTPLSARGVAQAELVAQRIAALKPAAILSSDLPRALQTAEAIARAAGGLPIETSALLHERNFGDLRGLPYDALGYDPLKVDDAPPNGESIRQFVQRAALAFELAVRQRSELEGPLVVVSHGLVIRAWLGAQVPLGDGLLMPDRMGNTSLTITAPRPPHTAELVNCVRHLDGAAAEDAHSLSGG
jgi:2,3-bisphosphoglycerate-dependent phosphoglycerate mutase